MTTVAKERPILFKGRLVRAILENRKTQTRRVAKLTAGGHVRLAGRSWHPDDPAAVLACPHGQPGDRLWVRESWAADRVAGAPGTGTVVVYRASCEGDEFDFVDVEGDVSRKCVTRWRPSIHMPRWACRIELDVLRIRLERLQSISEEDAKAEGVQIPVSAEGCPPGKAKVLFDTASPYRPWALGHEYRAEFASLWDTINAPRGFGWTANPWVWVVEFGRVIS